MSGTLANIVPFSESACVSGAELVILSFIAGLGVAVFTTPVGVSGAVFLLPIQLTVLHVPSPAVTPTNLLFNIVAVPGALTRYRTPVRPLDSLTAVLLSGTVPGVILGAIIRVLLLPGGHAFRILLAGFLLPLGIWLCLPARRRPATTRPMLPSRLFTAALAATIGAIGGIYGIGGGSLLSPILVAGGLPVATVAPAALLTTFVTSIAGALTYVVLAITTAAAHVAPNWTIGLLAGAGGLVGGYLGARLQPRLPDRALRRALGVLAISTAGLYIVQTMQ